MTGMAPAAPLNLYNTLTRRTEPLVPGEPGHVRMYLCGVTVYDRAHVGHARTWVVFDALARFLEWRGFRVTYVRNVTDIDDRIIERAAQQGISAAELGEGMTRAMMEDSTALGCRTPDVEPRATAHIDEMIALITRLEEKGLAYRSEGDVYFNVTAFPPYGKLSHRRIDDLRAGARVEIGEQKRHPEDFALWKGVKPGEPFWESPFGRGRPGWHIECSAMSTRYLGQPFDLHGGGEDLVFPHHENELAQSEGATGETFAQHWMHISFLRIDDEKMSKSLGNFVTIHDAVALTGRGAPTAPAADPLPEPHGVRGGGDRRSAEQPGPDVRDARPHRSGAGRRCGGEVGRSGALSRRLRRSPRRRLQHAAGARRLARSG